MKIENIFYNIFKKPIEKIKCKKAKARNKIRASISNS